MSHDNSHSRDAANAGARNTVPIADLAAQFNTLRAEMLAELSEVAGSAQYILGPKVEQFEHDFAAYIGVRHCVGVNSGTSALHLALICAGVAPGDEVITVPMTFIATSWAISYCHATPVYVDVDPVTFTMDTEQIENRITPRTKAILPVHLYGQCASMSEILEIGRRHGIPVIEDAAQAHGATLGGKKAGSMGQCGCFSFYPSKNLGAYGEGGAIVTDDYAIAERLRGLRDHAQLQRFHHSEIGFNYRMDGLQGAVLGVKLPHLPRWNEARTQLADRYQRLLGGLPIQLPQVGPGRGHAWHLYVALHPARDRIRRALDAAGIQSGLHYPIPLHLQKAYQHLGHRAGDFPVAERVANQCISLPLFAEMTMAQQDAVVAALAGALKNEPS